MIRPEELRAIRRGEIDLAFRRWDRPRVKVGTRMRTAVGVVEVTSVEPVAESRLRAEDARRAGAASLAALKQALAAKPGTIHRVGVRYAGADPREELRDSVPEPAEIERILAGLDRLDGAAPDGPWTRLTLRLIDDHPEVRAPDLAEQVGRPTVEFKRDVRKLKERGLTESLAIGYRISPRGEAVLDSLEPGGPRRTRGPRPTGTPLPRSIGAPATRALRAEGLTTLETVAGRSRAELASLHGVGPVALDRLSEALEDLGSAFSDGPVPPG